jgi:hypothetical protein
MRESLVDSFFIGAFDPLGDPHARPRSEDYGALAERGICTARERAPDPSHVADVVRDARALGVKLIWDLERAGTTVEDVRRLARSLRQLGERIPLIVRIDPADDPSFAIAACRALRDADPRARLVTTHSIVHVIADPDHPEHKTAAEAARSAHYRGWDILAGRARPELEGSAEYLDVVGVEYRLRHQWTFPGGRGSTLGPSHPAYRPPWTLFHDLFDRYHRPILITDAGVEGEAGSEWLRYLGHEIRQAIAAKVPIEGLCVRASIALREDMGLEITRQGRLIAEQRDGQMHEAEPSWDGRRLDAIARGGTPQEQRP